MALINNYTKQGTMVGIFDTDRFDLNQPVSGPSVQGLVQMGRSQSAHGRAEDAD